MITFISELILQRIQSESPQNNHPTSQHSSQFRVVRRLSSDADLLEGDALLRAREGLDALQAPYRGVLHLPLLHLMNINPMVFLSIIFNTELQVFLLKVKPSGIGKKSHCKRRAPFCVSVNKYI